MSSPAERYATSRRRQAELASPLGRFVDGYDFTFDPFQVRACEALAAGHGVLVAAPTGSGKTVVGEFAVQLALEQGRKCFYTTPIKALSNQKFHDLVARHGADQIGLLTGDNSVNGEAPVVVMTTEVLRNMLYAGSPTLRGLGFVVMDEVHYLADRFRGAVWEEVIIHLPESVAVVSLSATVSNAEEFGDWLTTVRGDTEVVVSEERPVPLWQHVMVGPRLLDLFLEATPGAEPGEPAQGGRRKINPTLLRYTGDDRGRGRGRDVRPSKGGRRPRRNGGAYTPSRVEVLDRLEQAGLLPGITFVFSRIGCDSAVRQCLSAGVRLTTPSETDEIRALVERRCADIPDEDLSVLGYHEWVEGLARGVAAHHAGMLPRFKEIVEELFVAGLVRAVFATETLALGINMPARSVVLERLVKWNGETHADVTPAEYTQLTGRAGRRGIDVEGHAVVLWQPGFEPTAVGGLASTRTYPLRSSFRPSYNMAVNLVGQVGRSAARELLESSFAQFQADRAVVGLAREVRRHEEAMDGYREAMTCHLGDFAEYAELRRAIADREKSLAREGTARRKAEAVESLEQLKPGDIVRVPVGKFAGLAVVLDPGVKGSRGGDGPRPTVLTEGRQVRRLSMVDFPAPVEPMAQMRIPRSFNRKVAASRRELAAVLRDRAPVHERGPGGAGRTGGGARGRDTSSGDRGQGHGSSRGGGSRGGGSRGGGRGRSAAADDQQLAGLRRELRAHPCHGCAEREDHARWAERWLKLRRDTEKLQRRVESRTNTVARQFDKVCALLQDMGYLRGDEVTPAGRRLARLYTEMDLLAAESLADGLWDDLDPAELAACLSALTYESRQPDDAMAPRLPPGNVPRVLGEMVRLWGDLDSLESDHGLDFLREPDLGFANVAWQWASGQRLEKVLGESDLTAGDFVRAMRQLLDLMDQVMDAAGDTPLRETARLAVGSLHRGVVAYTSLA